MKTIFDISTTFGDTRIHRQVTFDRETFDSLQDTKRLLNECHGDLLTNAEVRRGIKLVVIDNLRCLGHFEDENSASAFTEFNQFLAELAALKTAVLVVQG